jgi:hypothetical protein
MGESKVVGEIANRFGRKTANNQSRKKYKNKCKGDGHKCVRPLLTWRTNSVQSCWKDNPWLDQRQARFLLTFELASQVRPIGARILKKSGIHLIMQT